MTVQMGNPVDIDEDGMIQDAFEEFMQSYELEMEMMLEDILYEMFAAGFESALEYIGDE